MEQTKRLFEILQAFHNGEPIQIMHNGGWAIPTSEGHIAAAFGHDPNYVRLAPPKLTPIDLSVLVGSTIDCEFWNNYKDKEIIDCLYGISDCLPSYSPNANTSTKRCRPRMNHWHHWQGRNDRDNSPLPNGLNITIERRDGTKVHCETPLIQRGEHFELYPWGHYDSNSDIIGFQITNLADGYCWPWEVDQAERL